MPDITDPIHPDFVVASGEGVASKDEIAAAVAHMKAWFARELAKVEGKPAPAPAVPTPAPEPEAEAQGHRDAHGKWVEGAAPDATNG
jgi:hypothetical protein